MKIIRLLSRFRQYALPVVAVALGATGQPVMAAPVSLDLSTARLVISPKANSSIEFAGGARWPVTGLPALALEADGATDPAESAVLSGDALVVRFANGSRANFQVTRGRGFAVFRLTRLEAPQPVSRFRLFQLAAPLQARPCGTVNGAALEGNFAAVMAAKLNVRALTRLLQFRRLFQAKRRENRPFLTGAREPVLKCSGKLLACPAIFSCI
jgi:hypothetical protein